MTRSALFFLNLIVPVLLVALAGYVLRSRRVRGDVARPWALAVFLSALWSTHLASYYLTDLAGGGRDIVALELAWRNVAVYVLSGFALAVLWTTMRYMRIAPRLGWMTMVAGGILVVGAVALDPEWSLLVSTNVAEGLEIAGQSLGMFDLWAAVWGGSYLLPLLMGWILTQQTFRRLPSSLYRNQVAYWSLALALLLVAGPLALIQDPERSLWQFLAALLIGGTAVTATFSMVQRRLPNLRLTLRQGLRAIILGGAFFGLSWAALWFALETPTGRQLLDSPDGLLLAALIATLVFLFARQILGRLTRLLLLRLPDLPTMPLQQVRWEGKLLDPAALGEAVVDDVQRQLRVDEAWLLVCEEGPGGYLMLRPLVVAGDAQPEEVGRFGQESTFIQRLRSRQTVARTDLTALPEYDEMDAAERALLDRWWRDLYAPFVLDEELVAVLALGRRSSGEVYDDSDRLWLRALSTRVAPLLRQAQSAAQLHELSIRVFGEKEALVRQKRQQAALLSLYQTGLRLLKPELHQQLDAIDDRWRALFPVLPVEAEIEEEALSEPLAAVKEKVNDLLVAYARIEKQGPFAPAPVQIADLVREVVENLSTMARARRVEIHTTVDGMLPEVCGDADLLRDAIYQLAHNAVKFNKIGGTVGISCAVDGDEICLSVADDGVGIPADRLALIWEIQDSSRLGLTITRYVVEAHDGRYEAESNYGAGSRFSLYIPISGI